MKGGAEEHGDRSGHKLSLVSGLYFLAVPLPLPIVNIMFKRLMVAITTKRPELFARLAGHYHKTFLINPTNLPFVIELSPDPRQPRLRACRRRSTAHADASITGSFLTLMGLIDGRLDGDALFFSRDIKVEGDTEALVSLRNALDDIEGSIAQDIAAILGNLGLFALKVTRRISDRVHSH
ncbi:MAG: SCP2 sterol-binding domain-containing protein [Alphaproteobacteria bacterium]|nr:SCP2 sterol-binding domain-containing protein [Alphaproteobacteria bacterium]